MKLITFQTIKNQFMTEEEKMEIAVKKAIMNKLENLSEYVIGNTHHVLIKGPNKQKFDGGLSSLCVKKSPDDNYEWLVETSIRVWQLSSHGKNTINLSISAVCTLDFINHQWQADVLKMFYSK